MNNVELDDDKIPKCPICGKVLTLRLAFGRKSRKPFVMLLCSNDGRHFRGFISHRPFVQQVIDRIGSLEAPNSKVE
jgi:hypothetical protein